LKLLCTLSLSPIWPNSICEKIKHGIIEILAKEEQSSSLLFVTLDEKALYTLGKPARRQKKLD
jgi:hypothetical protein